MCDGVDHAVTWFQWPAVSMKVLTKISLTLSRVRSCHPSPVPAPTLTGATQVSVGGRHACAVVDGGAVRCWGDNNDGELGRL